AFTDVSASIASGSSGGIFAGVTAFAFAYEGWIIATTINSELKDAEKNLPKALIIGAIICVGVYMLYFVGISGALSWSEILTAGDNLPRVAFASMFGSAAGTIVFVFIVISCLGTMNGLILGCSRGMYSLAARGEGPNQKLFSEVSPKSNMAANSALIGLALAGFWLFYWQICFVDGFLNNFLGAAVSPVSLHIPLWFNWEPDEVSIIALYAFYIPIFISVMKNMKELGWVKRYLMPALALASCFFMIYCTIIAYKIQCLYFVIFLLIVLFIGFLFRIKKVKS
ncbi:MAG: APC family permease, partial [Eubacteriaceae bacterium]|nr:APC family permease [Eubacteriaceae bacterium]